MRAASAAVVLALLLAGCLGASAPEGPPGTGSAPEAVAEPLRFEAAGCRELVVQVPADAARVAAALPHGLQPATDAPGRTMLRLSVLDCADGNVSGTPGLFHLSEVYVGVVAPEGSHSGTAIFDFAVFAADAHLDAAFTAGGWPLDWANTGYTRVRGPAGPGLLTATWQSENFTYELQGTLDLSAPQPFAGGPMSCFRDIDGVLREFEWELGAGSLSLTGSGVFRASAGSPVAALLGATEAPASVAYVTFDSFSGRLRPGAGPTI